MIQKILKVGSSIVITLPEKPLKKIGLKIGDEVAVEVDKSRGVIFVKPADALSQEDAGTENLGL